MAKQLRLGLSPLTGTIFAGHLNKAGILWLNGKQDVTEDFYNTMGHLIPPGKGISIANENDGRFIYTCFPQTEEGIKQALNYFGNKLIKITKGEKL